MEWIVIAIIVVVVIWAIGKLRHQADIDERASAIGRLSMATRDSTSKALAEETVMVLKELMADSKVGKHEIKAALDRRESTVLQRMTAERQEGVVHPLHDNSVYLNELKRLI